jgi:hypothetical protein
MIITLQIIALLFSLAMIYFAILNYKRGEINSKEVASWAVIWTAVILIVLFPDIARTFARSFLFARLFDLLVVGGIGLAIFLSARAYVISRRNQKKLEEFIRSEALKNVKGQMSKNKKRK